MNASRPVPAIRLSESQVLLTGVYRSGTEFVTQLVSGHPALSATMYHVNAYRFITADYEPLSDLANLRRAIADTKQRLAERYGFALDAARVETLCAGAEPMAVERFYDAVMATLWLGGARRHWLEKAQLVWRQIPQFVERMPNGRAILVIRDPRSVVASFKRYTYAPPPAYLGAILNCQDAMRHGLAFRDKLPADRFLLLRYEDAARDPAGTSTLLYRFLGFDPGEAKLDPEAWRDSLGRNWAVNSVFAESREDFDVEKSIRRWDDNLAPWEIQLTEAVCGELMTAFNYRPETKALTDWRSAIRHILADRVLTDQFRAWLETGTGIQAFPRDPTRPENWEERALAASGSIAPSP